MNGVGVLNKKTPSPGLWLSWVGRCPMHPKVLGSIPGWGACGRQPSNVSPPPPAPLSLKSVKRMSPSEDKQMTAELSGNATGWPPAPRPCPRLGGELSWATR